MGFNSGFKGLNLEILPFISLFVLSSFPHPSFLYLPFCVLKFTHIQVYNWTIVYPCIRIVPARLPGYFESWRGHDTPPSYSPPPFRHLCALSAGRRYMPRCNNRQFTWQTFFIYSYLIIGDHNIKPFMRVQWLLKQEHHNSCVKETLFRTMVCCTGMLDTWKIQRIWLEQQLGQYWWQILLV